MKTYNPLNDDIATLTVEQVAQRLGVRPAAIYKAIARGTLPTLDLGGRKKMILRQAFEELLNNSSRKIMA